ncbi:MAG: nucleotide exchange factor GrpE [Wenzhouxiangella sp.]
MTDNKNHTEPSSPHDEVEEHPEASMPDVDADTETGTAGQDTSSTGDGDRPDETVEAEELGRLREALLRTRAEMDNLQKRAERELDKARKFATESLLKDLVPVIDSLDQGIENGSGDQDGLALTRKLLLDTLTRHGLEMIDPAGQPFDPQWHEAMSMQPSEEQAPDTVLMVLQKGYSLKGRVVRPARVIVSR